METRVDPTDLDGQPNRKIRERVRTQTITTPEGNPKPDQTLGNNLYSLFSLDPDMNSCAPRFTGIPDEAFS